MTRGVGQIVRFNWPFYALATTAAALALPAAARLPMDPAMRGLARSAIGLALFWIAGSLAASWAVYDRSPLMRWEWIPPALGFRPHAWVNIHAGLDESSPTLRRLFGDSSWRVFDIFDAVEMREPSIARARRLARNALAAEPADFRRLPAAADAVDTALLLLSAHELRTHEARRALFAELRRILTPKGRVIVAEHLRDWANFAAFGPGILHFHSRRAWRRCFTDSGFVIVAEFAITPFVRVFVLERNT